ncbi:MAG: hypothetical protein K9L32_08980 [Chromatiaceae bacterium]|nr:hypothetical protein [Chromatiaceae bacterium]
MPQSIEALEMAVLQLATAERAQLAGSLKAGDISDRLDAIPFNGLAKCVAKYQARLHEILI